MKADEIIAQAKKMAEKFVKKVETGRAISTETYADCKDLLERIAKYEEQRDARQKEERYNTRHTNDLLR